MNQVQKIFFIWFSVWIGIIQASNSAVTSQQLANAIYVSAELQSLLSSSSSSTNVSNSRKSSSSTTTTTPISQTVTGNWNGGNGYPPVQTFVATPNVLSSPSVINVSAPMYCSGGIQYINVALFGSSNTYACLSFPNIDMTSASMQVLAKKGFYILINLTQVNGNNVAQVVLTDTQGNVQATYTSQGLNANVGFTYANIGFNTIDSTLSNQPSNSTYVNWLPIVQQKGVYYQENSAAITSASAVGGITMPNSSSSSTGSGTNSTVLTPPATVTPVSLNGTYSSTAPFVQITASKPPVMYSGQQGVAMSCSGGLNFINVGLFGSTMQPAWVQIPVTGALTQLAAQGLYVSVNTIPSTTGNGNQIQVNITDAQGNLYAQAVGFGYTNGPTYFNVGFNQATSTHVSGNKQCFVNWVPVSSGQSVYYKQYASTTTSIGGITMPNAATTTLTPPTTITPMTIASNYVSSAPFVQTTASKPPVVYSGQQGVAMSCAGGLNFINVGLFGSTMQPAWAQIPVTGVLTQLAAQGLYVSVNTIPNSNGNNQIQINITDGQGNLFAQATAYGYSNAPLYFNVGFNQATSTHVSGQKQCYVDWVPVSSGQSVYYMQSTSTTASIGGITMPSSSSSSTGSGTSSTVNSSAPIMTQLSTNVWKNVFSLSTPPQGPIITTPNLVSMNNQINNPQVVNPGAALYCAGGLNEINVLLVGAQPVYAGLLISFQSLNIPTARLQALGSQGFYLFVNMMEQSGQNIAQVVITDTSGNIQATCTSQPLGPTVGLTWACIGFNERYSLNAPTSNATYANWILIENGQGVFYKDQGSATATSSQGIGGLEMPPLTLASKNITVPTGTLPQGQFAVNQACSVNNLYAPYNPQTGSNIQLGPVTCAGGLVPPASGAVAGVTYGICVALADSENSNFLAFQFTQNVLSQPFIAPLLAPGSAGLYIGTNLITQEGANYAQVVLMDQKANILAQGISQPLANNVGLEVMNVLFNMNVDEFQNNLPGNNQVFVAYAPLTPQCPCVFYQQGTGASSQSWPQK